MRRIASWIGLNLIYFSVFCGVPYFIAYPGLHKQPAILFMVLGFGLLLAILFRVIGVIRVVPAGIENETGVGRTE